MEPDDERTSGVKHEMQVLGTSERTTKAVFCLFVAILALGGSIYLFAFGKLSEHRVTRTLAFTVVDFTLQGQHYVEGIATPVLLERSTFPLENTVLELSFVVKTPPYIRTRTKISIKVLRGTLRLEKNEKVRSSMLAFGEKNPQLVLLR